MNRRLADALARTAADRWEVTAVAPQWLRGDLRPVPFEPWPDELNKTVVRSVYFTSRVHHLLYGWQTRAILQEPHWDLVHCWQEPFVLSATQIGYWSRPTPIIYYTYQNMSKRYPPPFNWCERWAIQRCSGWISGGQTVTAVVRQRPYYADKPNTIITLGVDTTAFRPDQAARQAIRRQLGWEIGPPIIGFLGRFVPEKGLKLLQSALQHVHSPWRLVLVGSGPMEAELRHWADTAPDRIRVVTGVKHQDVPNYLNAMDVLVAPSQTTAHWREQFGRMLVEAFACGLPVLASDSGEIPYVVADAGRVLPEADVTAWAKAITEVLESPELRQRMGQQGRERACQKYDWMVIARQHWDFFERILSESSRPSKT